MDSRYPCHYLTDRRVQRLSDAAHRTLVTATAWCVDNRTDGEVPTEDLDLIPRATAEHMGELVKRGLAVVTAEGWQLTEYSKTQTSAAQIDAALESRRASDRDRQARARAKKKEGPSATEGRSREPSRRPSREGHVTIGGEARRGEERRGKASSEEEVPSEGDFSNRSRGSDAEPVPLPNATPNVLRTQTAVMSEGSSQDAEAVDWDVTAPGSYEQTFPGEQSPMEGPSYCRVGGCANRPLPGIRECVEHRPDREAAEAAREREIRAETLRAVS